MWSFYNVFTKVTLALNVSTRTNIGINCISINEYKRVQKSFKQLIRLKSCNFFLKFFRKFLL